jgi:hypothetical protein
MKMFHVGGFFLPDGPTRSSLSSTSVLWEQTKSQADRPPPLSVWVSAPPLAEEILVADLIWGGNQLAVGVVSFQPERRGVDMGQDKQQPNRPV